MSEEIKHRIDELTKKINHHSYLYYVLASPKISDRQFDLMLKELEDLEEKNPQYRFPDSPTQRVGGAVTKDFETVQHRTRMMSLSNTYSKEELFDFHQRILKSLGEEPEYTCELKYDGFAISLIYEDGLLVRAVTRGDGVQGDDVTANVKTIRRIPHRLNEPVSIEARGEVFMHRKAFEKLNADRVEEGLSPFANPRNSAAGTIKMQEADEVAKRPLDIYMYQMVVEGGPQQSHAEGLKRLESLGLPVHEALSVCKGFDEVWNFIEHWDDKRKTMSFETDGVVVKVNSYLHQQELGSTAKAPRWAIAYKFETERAYTILESVDFQVGRTGAVTPVANLEPVQLLGTTVKRASLHNADFIAQMDLHLGDTVGVEKGGEIIPKIVDVNTSARPIDADPVTFVTHCPECNNVLERNEGEAAFFCPNVDGCPPQIKGRIEHFLSRKAMDIDSLGEGKIEILFDNELVRSPADLYDLKFDDLLGIGKTIVDEETGKERFLSFKERTTEKILSGIEASKDAAFSKVLYALGIRYVGETVSKTLASHFGDMDRLRNATKEELVAINEIGERIAQSVVDFFSQEKNVTEVERLKAAGLNLENEEIETASDSLVGKQIVVSGVFENVSRSELKKLIEEHGGKNGSSLSKNTAFIVAGDKMGPAKKDKAEKLGIPLVSEAEFMEMIGM
jgi:DNA ligase (NAD+)